MKNKQRAKITMMTKTTILMTLALLLGIFAAEARAATFTVMNTNDSGAGSLRDQVTNAAAGDTIVFDSTVFASAQTINLTSAFFSKQQIDSKKEG